jgi:flagellar motor switch protein FliG
MALSGYEKAAIFLSIVGEEVAAEVLKNLDIKQLGKLTKQMKQMKTIDKGKIEEVMKEVSDVISKGDILVGEEFIKKVLSKGLGEDKAEKILDMASEVSPIDSLKWIDPKLLANFLATEHPQTIALIMCFLEPVQAAEVLTSLPEKLRVDVAMRIASIERISESTIKELEEILDVHLKFGKGEGMKIGGIKTVAEILNQCDKSNEETILKKIEEQSETLAESIRQLMFVFDDLINLDDRSIQMLLKEVSTEDLSVALKTASETLKEKIFKNMSQRAAQLLKEEIELKGPVRVSEVQKAQQNIVKIAKKLEEEGKIVLKKGEEDFAV